MFNDDNNVRALYVKPNNYENGYIINYENYFYENNENAYIDNFVNNDENDADINFSTNDIALATKPGASKKFDPSNRCFDDQELKPRPIAMKSRKHFVPDVMKNANYWAHRAKNNLAAKRSREAKRLRENQIALRAIYLEKENEQLREKIRLLEQEKYYKK